MTTESHFIPPVFGLLNGLVRDTPIIPQKDKNRHVEASTKPRPADRWADGRRGQFPRGEAGGGEELAQRGVHWRTRAAVSSEIEAGLVELKSDY